MKKSYTKKLQVTVFLTLVVITTPLICAWGEETEKPEPRYQTVQDDTDFSVWTIQELQEYLNWCDIQTEWQPFSVWASYELSRRKMGQREQRQREPGYVQEGDNVEVTADLIAEQICEKLPELVNRERKQLNKYEVKQNDMLDRSAQKRAEDMVHSMEINHDGSRDYLEGVTAVFGECIWVSYGLMGYDAEKVIEDLMASSSHKTILMQTHDTDIGVGASVYQNNMVVVIQMGKVKEQEEKE